MSGNKGQVIHTQVNMLRIGDEGTVERIKIVNRTYGKFESVTDHLFVFGDTLDFMDGLTKKIKSCYRSMEEECTKNDNGKYIKEYNYVVRQKAQESRDLKQPHRIRDQGHNGMSLKDFCGLPEAKDAKLSEAEVAALRLYTGPLYIPWNEALRRYPTNPELVQDWGTCISVLYSAILKLSTKTKNIARVYRGVDESKKKLPERFLTAAAGDFAGGTELAFMSTTTDKTVALEYANKSGNNKFSIFEIDLDYTSKAASVQWVSQYPYENELLYTPCTSLTTKTVGLDENGTRIIKMSATVSTNRPNTDFIKTVKDRDEAAAKAMKKVFVMPTLSKTEPQSEKNNMSDKRRVSMNNMKSINMPLQEYIKSVHKYTARELKQTGWFTLEEMVKVFSSKQLYDAGYSVIELANANCEVEDSWFQKAYDNGETIQDLTAAGWNLCKVEDSWFQKAYNKGESIQTLIDAGWNLNIAHRQSGTAFVVDLLKKHSLLELKQLPIADELVTFIQRNIKILDDVVKSNSPEDLREFGIQGYHLRKRNIPAETLKSVGYSSSEIYSIEEMKAKSASIDTVRSMGYSEYQLERAGYVSTLYRPERVLFGDLVSTGAIVMSIVTVDDNTLVTADSGNMVRMWSISKGKCIRTMAGHAGVVHCLLLLDQNLVASGSHDGTVKIWDLSSGQCTETITSENYESQVTVIQKLSDGNLLLISDMEIRVWSLSQRECVLSYYKNQRTLSMVKLTEEEGEEYYLSVDPDNYETAEFWKVSSSKIECIGSVDDYRGGKFNFLLVLSSGLVVSIDDAGSLVFSNFSASQVVKGTRHNKVHNSAIYAITELRNGCLVTASEEYIKIHDVTDCSELKCLGTIHLLFHVFSILELSSGDLVLQAGEDLNLVVWRHSDKKADKSASRYCWMCCC